MTVTSTITADDGVTLAVHRYTDIDPARPTILAIHGFPDNHHVWDGVADELTGAPYNFVAYDVRGAGESSCPATRSGYGFAQLVRDMGAVIDSLGVGRVHLLAHDWGSIQAWAAVTDKAVTGESVMDKVASFTSISGPHLNYAGTFLHSARTPRAVARVVRQLIASGYIGFFLCPGAAELSFRAGIGVKVIAALERIGHTSTRSQRRDTRRSLRDYLNGLQLYRQNMPAPMLAPGPRLPETTVPVQTLVPRRDVFVTPALQRFTGAIPQRARVIEIEGGHWVVTSRPDVIARLTTEWVDLQSAGAVAPQLTGKRRELPPGPAQGSVRPPRWNWPVRAPARS